MITINELLPNTITEVDHTMLPLSFKGDTSRMQLTRHYLSEVINDLGDLSSKAQNLNKTITSSEKLLQTPDVSLYLLKDSQANNGNGAVIGFLKTGMKKLYLFDENGQNHNVKPLCVLDFYILEHYQKHGYGKYLFDYVLKANNTTADQIAVDGPSVKMENFLKKHYGWNSVKKQFNNFAVAPNFFTGIDNTPLAQQTESSPQTPTVGRFTAPKRMSLIGNIIHSGNKNTQNHTLNNFDENNHCQTPNGRHTAPKPKTVVDKIIHFN